jgi:hypothetical protein
MGVIAVNDGVESRILAAGRAGRLVPETRYIVAMV